MNLTGNIGIQGELACVQGIALTGLRADSTAFEALGRMSQLRILVLDGVKMESVLSGFHIPRLAMLSWRDASEPSLPFSLDIIRSAAVLDLSGRSGLDKLPADLQACSPLWLLFWCF